jgi:hypothetical protein
LPRRPHILFKRLAIRIARPCMACVASSDRFAWMIRCWWFERMEKWRMWQPKRYFATRKMLSSSRRVSRVRRFGSPARSFMVT